MKTQTADTGVTVFKQIMVYIVNCLDMVMIEGMHVLLNGTPLYQVLI